MQLSGNKILITGGATGIGLALAVFEQLEAGRVTATYAHTEALSRAGEDVLGSAFARLNQGR